MSKETVIATVNVSRASLQPGQIHNGIQPVSENDRGPGLQIKIQCPNCGETIGQTAAYHVNSLDELCIIDPLRTLRAGRITRAKYNELTAERAEKGGDAR